MTFHIPEEIDKAIEFGFMCVNSGQPFPPTLACFKEDDPKVRLIVGSAPYDNTEDKDRAFTMLGFTARAWGATDVVLVADAHYVDYSALPPEERPSGMKQITPPSEDPRAKDCIMSYHFDRKGNLTSVVIPYHLDEDGKVVRGGRVEDFNPASEAEGRIVDTIGAAMTLPTNIPADLLASIDLDIEAHLKLMADNGFIVMHSTSEETTFIAPGVEMTEEEMQREASLQKLRDLWKSQSEE